MSRKIRRGIEAGDPIDGIAQHDDSSKRWPIRLTLLLVGHVLLLAGASLLCAILPSYRWQAFGLAAVLPAQACLIGVWLGMGKSRTYLKGFVAFGSVIGLGLVLAANLSASSRGQFNLLWYLPVSTGFIAAPMTATAILLFVAQKRTRGSLQRCCGAQPSRVEAFQFGVRHLFLVTLAVAVLLGLGKGAPRLLADAEAVVGPVAGLGLVGTVWATVTLAVVWATLGKQRPRERVAAAMALAFFGGVVPPYYFGEDLQTVAFWGFALAALAMAIVMATSLLVARSAGYRFVIHDDLPTSSLEYPERL